MIEIEGIPSSQQLFTQLKEEGKPVILNFSRGKDSVAVWARLKEYDIPVIPIHKSLVPGLKFIKDDLARYEDHYQTKIHDLPSDAFLRMLANNIYQTPERCAVVEACRVPQPSREEWDNIVQEAYGDGTTWFLDGVRATDSATRRMAIKKYGPAKRHTNRMSPIWDYGVADVRQAVKDGGIELGIDYTWWPRSFDAIRWDYLEAIRDNAPEDWEHIKFWFPLVELEMDREGDDGR